MHRGDAERAVSVRLLRVLGTASARETQTLLAGAQVDIFNGDGTGTHHATVSLNGEIARFGDVLLSYTVDKDCAGTITLHLPFGTINSDMYIAPDGEEFVVIQTDAGSVLAGASRRVSRK